MRGRTAGAQPAPGWRRMLEATPVRNAAAEVEMQADGTARVGVALRRPWWLVLPVSWIVRPAARHNVQLDALGTQVWLWCDGRRTVEDVVDAFAARYALTFHEARIAVTGYLKLLVQRGIVAMEQ